MTAIDLTAARRQLEAHMTDHATITRDTEGTGDDVFDPVTGNLTLPVGDTAVVYRGPCLFTRLENVPHINELGSVDEARERYQVSIPAAAPLILVGDVVTIDGAANPGSIGASLAVKSCAIGTYLARTRLTCELATPGPRT